MSSDHQNIFQSQPRCSPPSSARPALSAPSRRILEAREQAHDRALRVSYAVEEKTHEAAIDEVLTFLLGKDWRVHEDTIKFKAQIFADPKNYRWIVDDFSAPWASSEEHAQHQSVGYTLFRRSSDFSYNFLLNNNQVAWTHTERGRVINICDDYLDNGRPEGCLLSELSLGDEHIGEHLEDVLGLGQNLVATIHHEMSHAHFMTGDGPAQDVFGLRKVVELGHSTSSQKLRAAEMDTFILELIDLTLRYPQFKFVGDSLTLEHRNASDPWLLSGHEAFEKDFERWQTETGRSTYESTNAQDVWVEKIWGEPGAEEKRRVEVTPLHLWNPSQGTVEQPNEGSFWQKIKERWSRRCCVW